ncbi:hypothetical protein D3C73_1454140 [compost metagenome]
MFRSDAESGLQSLEMFVVLPQWVLECECLFIQLLCPLRLPFVTEYPATFILGLHNEDAVGRQEYMVNLGGAIDRIQRDVVRATVGMLVQ